MEAGSYFRLQQTCRGVYDFIRTSRNISVHLSGKYYLAFKRDTRSWQFGSAEGPGEGRMDEETLYGTRLEELRLCGQLLYCEE